MALSFVVDGTNYIHTLFAGTNGEYNAADSLRRLIAEFQRRYRADVCVCFDAPGTTWRHEIYPAYKGTRNPKDPRLVVQLADAQEHAEFEGLLYPQHEGYEADDLIAMRVAERISAGDRVVIVSRDKDCRQLLIDERVSMLPRVRQWKGEWFFEFFTAKDLTRECGLHPVQWADYRALTGDPSDNWPGCEDIGPRTAQKILQRAGTLEVAMGDLWRLPVGPKQRDKLRRFDWQLGRRLMTLVSRRELQAA